MFYLVDKPVGIGSNLVAKIMKRVLNTPRIGFLGTLDPLASGCMILATNASPRLFPLIENLTKTYLTTIRLDGTTDTYDLEKPVSPLNIDKKIIASITCDSIRSVIDAHFMGDILQVPPNYSATWIDGKRAYALARQGQTFTIEPKNRTILSFFINKYIWPTLEATITVSSGTYIRSIARDLGAFLNTGGYLEKLRRTAIGTITLEKRNWLEHNDIKYCHILHDELFPQIHHIDLDQSQKDHMKLGSTPLPTSLKDGSYFIQYSDISYGLLEAKKGLLYAIKNGV